MRQGEHTFLSRDSTLRYGFSYWSIEVAILVMSRSKWYMSGLDGVSVGLFKHVHVFKAGLAGHGQVTEQLAKRIKVSRSTEQTNKTPLSKEGTTDPRSQPANKWRSRCFCLLRDACLDGPGSHYH
jgi:hypothetical protein